MCHVPCATCDVRRAMCYVRRAECTGTSRLARSTSHVAHGTWHIARRTCLPLLLAPPSSTTLARTLGDALAGLGSLFRREHQRDALLDGNVPRQAVGLGREDLLLQVIDLLII